MKRKALFGPLVIAIGSRIMESYAESFGVKEQFDTSSSFHSLWNNVSKEQLLDKLLFFVKAVVEYAFGIYIGYAIGWLIGICVGHSYVEHFEPVYLDDLGQLSYWWLLPYGFARNVAITGSIMGAIAIAIINNKLLNQRIVSLYKTGSTNPNDIARLLGKSVGQIERKMNKLVKSRESA